MFSLTPSLTTALTPPGAMPGLSPAGAMPVVPVLGGVVAFSLPDMVAADPGAVPAAPAAPTVAPVVAPVLAPAVAGGLSRVVPGVPAEGQAPAASGTMLPDAGIGEQVPEPPAVALPVTPTLICAQPVRFAAQRVATPLTVHADEQPSVIARPVRERAVPVSAGAVQVAALMPEPADDVPADVPEPPKPTILPAAVAPAMRAVSRRVASERPADARPAERDAGGDAADESASDVASAEVMRPVAPDVPATNPMVVAAPLPETQMRALPVASAGRDDVPVAIAAPVSAEPVADAARPTLRAIRAHLTAASLPAPVLARSIGGPAPQSDAATPAVPAAPPAVQPEVPAQAPAKAVEIVRDAGPSATAAPAPPSVIPAAPDPLPQRAAPAGAGRQSIAAARRPGLADVPQFEVRPSANGTAVRPDVTPSAAIPKATVPWRFAAVPAAAEAAPPVDLPPPDPVARANGSTAPTVAPQAAPVPPPASAPAGIVFASARAVAADDRDQRPVRASAPAIEPTALAAPAAAPLRLDTGSQAPLDLSQPRWPQAMIERIEVLRDAADAADTRIRLIPDALGAIDIAVKRDGDTIHVAFTAEQAQTRTLLQEAQPRLAEAAADRGLKLGQTSVEPAPGNNAGQGSAQTAGQGSASSATSHGLAQGQGQNAHSQTPQGRQQQPATPARPLSAHHHANPDDATADDARIA